MTARRYKSTGKDGATGARKSRRTLSSKPTPAQLRARSRNIKKAQAARWL